VDLQKICQKGNRIPIGYREDKDKAIFLLEEIKDKNIRIKNPDIYSLASWVGFNIGKYDYSDTFSEVEEIKYGEKENTYDMHIKNGNSYVANGIICHNTVNLPEDVSVEEVSKIYQTAWEAGCKGITVYRKNCRTGVLVDNTKEEKGFITKTNAPKRPPILPADIYHTISKGEQYFVIVGLMGDDPYEIFAGKHDKDIRRNVKNGMLKKIKRGRYSLLEENGEIILEDFSKSIDEDQEAITRLISSNLRHGCDVSFVVHQLEKVKGDLLSFSKAISRVLKKYIPENVVVHGEVCKECGADLIREQGCVACRSCGWSRC